MAVRAALRGGAGRGGHADAPREHCGSNAADRERATGNAQLASGCPFTPVKAGKHDPQGCVLCDLHIRLGPV